MAIRIKVAQTPNELEDAFGLRYQVSVGEEGYLDANSFPDEMVIDSYDRKSHVVNIVAYADSGAVGTMRIHLELGQDNPPGAQNQVGDIYQDLASSWSEECDEQPRVGAISMLAVRRTWRHRRDVIRAMFKLAAGVAQAWSCTHMLAVSNPKTSGIYERVGFKTMEGSYRLECFGGHVAPMTCEFSKFHHWAFAGLAGSLKMLDFFSHRFQRLILAPEENVFRQGDRQGEAYIIDSGAIRISKGGPSGEELTLATLGRGQMFGELALIDTQPRSAHATTLAMTELIALDGEEFFNALEDQPHRIRGILRLFSERLRRTDELAFVMVHGSARQRIEHALLDIRKMAMPDEKRPGTVIARISLAELARQAGVCEADVHGYLETKKHSRNLEFNTRRIRFLNAG